jgi:hypothetical protein
MTEVWTGRKILWNSAISGFHSLDAMVDWAQGATTEKSGLFRPLFLPREGEAMVAFCTAYNGVKWSELGELTQAQKKATRYDYHKWLRELKSSSSQVALSQYGLTVKRMNGFEPANVKLFSGIDSSGEERWGLVWGMDLDNEKENFLPSYATRELEEDAADTQPGSSVQATGLRFQEPSRVHSDRLDSEKESESTKLGDYSHKAEHDGFKVWFSSHRKVLTVVAFGVLFLGIVHQLISG